MHSETNVESLGDELEELRALQFAQLDIEEQVEQTLRAHGVDGKVKTAIEQAFAISSRIQTLEVLLKIAHEIRLSFEALDPSNPFPNSIEHRRIQWLVSRLETVTHQALGIYTTEHSQQ